MTRELFCLKSKITVHVGRTPKTEKAQLPSLNPLMNPCTDTIISDSFLLSKHDFSFLSATPKSDLEKKESH